MDTDLLIKRERESVQLCTKHTDKYDTSQKTVLRVRPNLHGIILFSVISSYSTVRIEQISHLSVPDRGTSSKQLVLIPMSS